MLTLLLPSECKLSDASAERIAAAIFSGSPLERLGYVSVYTARGGMHLCCVYTHITRLLRGVLSHSLRQNSLGTQHSGQVCGWSLLIRALPCR